MILDKIVAATRIRLATLHAQTDIETLELQIAEMPPARPFAAALRHADRLGLVAEIKKASPSKGLIAPDFDAAAQAAIYQDSGADCLSILTEPDFFQGSLDDLKVARYATDKPVIRKEFILDPLQIAEARVAGADCILLIMSILSDEEIRQFQTAARGYGLDALVEVHDETEARRAVDCGCEFVGINNRDLKTFDVDLGTTARLRPLFADDAIIVGESGVFTRADAQQLREAGADALLVGESLMKSGDAKSAIAELLG